MLEQHGCVGYSALLQLLEQPLAGPELWSDSQLLPSDPHTGWVKAVQQVTQHTVSSVHMHLRSHVAVSVSVAVAVAVSVAVAVLEPLSLSLTQLSVSMNMRTSPSISVSPLLFPLSLSLTQLMCPCVFSIVSAALLTAHCSLALLGAVDRSRRRCRGLDGSPALSSTPPGEAVHHCGLVPRSSRVRQRSLCNSHRRLDGRSFLSK